MVPKGNNVLLKIKLKQLIRGARISQLWGAAPLLNPAHSSISRVGQ